MAHKKGQGSSRNGRDSVSKRLAKETPNSWYVNQYDNPSNALAHYEQTGPEIWEQTEGKITHFVGIQEDVTEAKEISKKLSYQASHDELTGLINRHEFERRLNRVVATAKKD